MVRMICVAAAAWARRRRRRREHGVRAKLDGVGRGGGVRRNAMVLPRVRRAAAESAGKSGSAAALYGGGPRGGRVEKGCSGDAAARGIPVLLREGCCSRRAGRPRRAGQLWS